MKTLLLSLLIMLGLGGCGLTDKDPKPVEPFLVAKVNNMDWRIKEGKTGATRAQLFYDENFKHHFLTINASKDSLLADGNSYDISITVRHTASAGRFEFEENPLPGYSVTGNIIIRRPTGETYIRGASIDGYVDIEKLTRHNLKGTFAFTAVTAQSTSYGGYPGGDTIRFEDGKFNIDLIGGLDSRWEL